MTWQYNREQGVKTVACRLKMKNPAFPFEKTGFLESGAGNEIRTRDPNLGKVVLYQLSYSRLINGRVFYGFILVRQLFFQDLFHPHIQTGTIFCSPNANPITRATVSDSAA
jgi:hypothetical protein